MTTTINKLSGIKIIRLEFHKKPKTYPSNSGKKDAQEIKRRDKSIENQEAS
jgi:hypothetical protein